MRQMTIVSLTQKSVGGDTVSGRQLSVHTDNGVTVEQLTVSSFFMHNETLKLRM